MARGFLDDIDMAVIRGDEGKKKGSKPHKTFSCADCGLQHQCQTPKMPAWGSGKKKILIVLDTPSVAEDEKGEPWAGAKGLLLKELLQDRLRLNVKRDCWTIFAVRCCARKAIKGINSEACRKYLHEDIKELDPAAIIPVGYWPMMGVSGDILTGKSRGRSSGDWAGFAIPDQRFRKWVCPTWDAFTLNLDGKKPDNVRIEQLLRHFGTAIEKANEAVAVDEYEGKVQLLIGSDKIVRFLSRMNAAAKERGELVLSLDYETTGRKPHRKGHKITSIAISNGKKAWAFPYDNDDGAVRNAFGSLLASKRVKWRVHNVQFEWLWSYNIVGKWPLNLDQDTILGIHAYNSQKRVGLKPNVYALFGVGSYDGGIEEFISAPSAEESMRGANAFNLMAQAPERERLTYNALDAYFTYRIAEWLKENLRKENWKGYRFLMASAINLVKCQQNGMRVNAEGVGKAKEELSASMSRIDGELNRLAVKQGWRKGVPFRPSAPADVAKLVYDIMGNKPTKFTPSNEPSTDKEALEKINQPVTNGILEWKKLQKLRDTYLSGLTREVVGGVMRPFFNLYTTVTYRSSSNDPNFQNIPVRDKASSRIIRSLLLPHAGHKLCEYDYKGIEVIVAACYTKDKNLIKYVTDPSTDMHRDTGIELFIYDDNPQDFQKYDRQVAKGDFVFASFYGSYFEQTAPALWNHCSPEARKNMRANGVRHFCDFLEHVREVEKSFWERRFYGYAQWKKEVYKLYLKHGYVDSYTGFRLYGPMTKNEVLNTCIQGSAHHVLLNLFNKTADTIAERKMQSKQIGQIHDSMINSTHPDEENYLDKIIWHHGTQTARDVFDWLIVPIEIEKAAGGIDMPWSEVEELGMLGLNGKVAI